MFASKDVRKLSNLKNHQQGTDDFIDLSLLTNGCAVVAASPKLTKIQLEFDRSWNSDAIRACVASTMEKSALEMKTPESRIGECCGEKMEYESWTTDNVPIRRTASMLMIFLCDVVWVTSSLKDDFRGDAASSVSSFPR